jgi:hypothetical protein
VWVATFDHPLWRNKRIEEQASRILVRFFAACASMLVWLALGGEAAECQPNWNIWERRDLSQTFTQ